MKKLSPDDREDLEKILAQPDLYPNPSLVKRLFEAYKDVTQFQNPTPVVAALLPIKTITRTHGVILIRRGNEPGKGQLALPGGYLEIEEWREGLAREIWEELKIRVQPEEFVPKHVVSGRDNQVLLIIAQSECLLLSSSLEPHHVNDEVSERVIATAPVELAFPSHTEAVRAYFESLHRVKHIDESDRSYSPVKQGWYL